MKTILVTIARSRALKTSDTTNHLTRHRPDPGNICSKSINNVKVKIPGLDNRREEGKQKRLRDMGLPSLAHLKGAQKKHLSHSDTNNGGGGAD